MALYFITGNKNKYAEASAIIPNVKQLDIDLPEIQEIDAKEIIKAKLLEAYNHKQAEFIVEDTSLYLDCLNGLPGPLIKWFLQALGNEGLYNLANSMGKYGATAKTIVGYAKNKEEMYYFDGEIKGTIISPSVTSGFGWDPIFQPMSQKKSFAELSAEEKNNISMRRIALNKLKSFLSTQG